MPRRQQAVRLSSRADLSADLSAIALAKEEALREGGVEGSRLGPAGRPLGWGRVISTPALRAFAQDDSKGVPNRRCAPRFAFLKFIIAQ